jgi:hypothetical protein
MASPSSAALCALLGLLLWTITGWVVARRLPLPGALALPIAPTLGWAVQNVVALTLSLAAGLSNWTMLGAVGLVGAAALLMPPRPDREGEDTARIPSWFYAAAAVLALLPAAAVLPKFTAGGVLLSAPIFDHSKIALVAEIVRNGVPPINPIFAEAGTAPGVAYYYLWHFGAAQLARLTGASAWEADVASSWFTAFSSLSLMGGLAFHVSRRALAPFLVLLACCTGSLRPTLAFLLGQERLDQLLRPASGFAGWLFQTTWSPHHVAAAGCTLLSALLMACLAIQPSAFTTLVLALLVAAGFGSSIWVGGVTFALAGTAVALVLLWATEPDRRLRFLSHCLAAALVAVLLSVPLILEQAQAAGLRGGGAPIILRPARVLGPMLPDILRRILDLPAYWVILLVAEFPVIIIGAIALWRCGWPGGAEQGAGRPKRILAVLAAASLLCGWLLVSTAGENNDLGWRSILPAVLILTAAAAGESSRWLARRSWAVALATAVIVAAALPDAARVALGNVTGDPSPSAAVFAETPVMWEAVRRHAAAEARIANNPRFMADVTPWAVNISWALLSNRRSCFAGNELALVFTFLPAERRSEISARFIRVFAGDGMETDLNALAETYGCDVVVVTSEDGAWLRDPFARTPQYQLAEVAPGRWRIYVKKISDSSSD